jgi:hypothetical protein
MQVRVFFFFLLSFVPEVSVDTPTEQPVLTVIGGAALHFFFGFRQLKLIITIQFQC